ncbi:MAG TPA: dihydrolipoamide acetyltransferase family protein [Burkholderiales bacterium]|nr:dihydrolipoamide acetyltransferase family protein [Burkholderiales bacterium]
MIEFKLPSLGAEMDEGTLLEWKVKPGDRVKKGDVVAVVDTSKSAIDVEIWEEGTIYELMHEPKETLPVGTVIAHLLEPGETPEHAEEEKRRMAAEAKAAAPPAAPSPAPVPGLVPAPAPPSAEARVRASPAARQRARDLNVDLAVVTGTGPHGAITIEDVEKAAAAAAQPPDRATEMRRAIAAAMARSKREIPHYYLATDIPLARASQWLTARNEQRSVTERVLMAVPLLKAVALALKRYPELNGFFRDGAFVPGAGIHLGVAISLRQGGLIAPAIRDVDRKGLDELMRALSDLVGRARALTLRSSEMSDATVTVTNLGDQGVDLVHGVIYPPQVALIGFGKITQRPWVEDGKVVVAPVLTASLSADHRASDGHRGALFLVELARALQDPEKLDTGTG